METGSSTVVEEACILFINPFPSEFLNIDRL